MLRLARWSILAMSCTWAPLAAQVPYLVRDIYPGASNNSTPQDFVAVGDRILFTATPSQGFLERAWASDGTSAGTLDLQTGMRVAFLAGSGATRGFIGGGILGGDLWVTGGTLPGTTPVPVNTNLLSGSGVAVGDQLFAARGPFLFGPSGPGTVISTDGATAQTVASYPSPEYTAMVGLAGDDPIWVSGSGPVTGVRTLHSLSSGVLGTVSNVEYDYVFTGTKRVFFGQDNIGPTLYETDGKRLRTVLAGAGGVAGPRIIGVVDDDLYFWADDGNGEAIYIDDLETPSPRIVTTFAAAGTTRANGPGAQLGDALVFWGVSAQGFQPWILAGGTAREIGTTGSSNGGISSGFYSVGSRRAFFYTGLSRFDDLWWTDGSVIEHVAFASSANVSDQIALAGGRAYFAAWDASAGCELWAMNPGATSKSFGTTCGGPWMRADDPVLGTTVGIVGEATAGDAGTVLLTGGSVAPGIEIAGCELYVNPLVSAVFDLGAFTVPVDGEWASSLSLPSNPVFVGVPLLIQSAFIGSTLTMSNGVVMFLGN